MDAPDFAWQVPQPPSSNGFFPRSRSDNRSSVNLRNANRPSSFPSLGTRHNVSNSCNSNYKKEKCKNFWVRGRCDYGDKCAFAHGAEELNKSNVMNYLEKPKTCWYSWRQCPYGEKCIFLHEASKQHGGIMDCLSRENSVISIEPIGGNPKLKYKTALCHKWMRLNSCTRGSNCVYAHGQAELRKKTPVFASESENEQVASMVAVKDSIPKKDQKSTASNKQIPVPKVCSYKWKKTKIKKIVNIYADWIDEESLLPCMASEN